MAKLLYSATMSLDGVIAGPEGDMSWLQPHLHPDPHAEQLMRDTGALLVGNRTFRGDDPNAGTDDEGAFSGMWDGPQVVLTHRPPTAEVPGVTFSSDLNEAVSVARTAAGDRYVNVLGADVARQCLEAGLLDEVLMIVAPVLLGDGVRMFERPGGADVQLERLQVIELPHVTYLWFRVLREPVA